MKPLAALRETITDFGDALGIGKQRRQQAFSAAEAEKQRNWEEQMSNTAVQRQVADMEKAGINPAMAFSNSNANGASTPNSSAANSNSGSTNDTISNLINSAANLTRAFNYDKSNTNDVGPSEAVSIINAVAKLL